MMTTEFLIGAIRASQDLHPLVKTELEEILHKEEPASAEERKAHYGKIYKCGRCGTEYYYQIQRYCQMCGKPVTWS